MISPLTLTNTGILLQTGLSCSAIMLEGAGQSPILSVSPHLLYKKT